MVLACWLRLRLDVQAHGGNAAIRPAVAGLLADATISTSQRIRHLLLEKLPFFALAAAGSAATLSCPKSRRRGVVGGICRCPPAWQTRWCRICVTSPKHSGRWTWRSFIRIPVNGRLCWCWPPCWCWHSEREGSSGGRGGTRIGSSAGFGSWEPWSPSSASSRSARNPWPTVIMYLPGIGLFIAVAWALNDLANLRPAGGRYGPGRHRRAGGLPGRHPRPVELLAR